MGKWDIKQEKGWEGKLVEVQGTAVEQEKRQTEEGKQKLSPLLPLVHKATSLMSEGASLLHKSTSKSTSVPVLEGSLATGSDLDKVAFPRMTNLTYKVQEGKQVFKLL